MTTAAKRVAVFGSTGSIGASALEVIEASGGALQAIALSAHSRVDELAAQAKRFRPRWIIASNPEAAVRLDRKKLPRNCELLVGPEALTKVAQHADVDVLLAGIVGRAGLESTWAALEHGKTVALANKETMVMAGELVSRLVAEKGGRLLPVDSEHSALFQALQSGSTEEVARLVLTASGGPFKNWPLHELQQITVAEALAHPTWTMGPKITIDSATMMNKALEIVEARWLFGVSAEKIEVVIHPQSVVHSLVEFVDGSVVAQMSPPTCGCRFNTRSTTPTAWRGAGGGVAGPSPAAWSSNPRTAIGFRRLPWARRRPGQGARPAPCSTRRTRPRSLSFWRGISTSPRSSRPAAACSRPINLNRVPRSSSFASSTGGRARRYHVGYVHERGSRRGL